MWLVATILDIDIKHFKDIKHFHRAKRSPGAQNEMNNSTQYWVRMLANKHLLQDWWNINLNHFPEEQSGLADQKHKFSSSQTQHIPLPHIHNFENIFKI